MKGKSYKVIVFLLVVAILFTSVDMLAIASDYNVEGLEENNSSSDDAAEIAADVS